MRMRGLSPLVARHFRRDGRAKKKYTTLDEAKEQASRQHKTAYLCEFCGLYHIGGAA